jgi:hypothetical protein
MTEETTDLGFSIEIASPGEEFALESARDRLVEATRDKIAQIADVIGGAAESMLENLKKLPEKPTEIAIEFGINVGAEGQVPFVTKGSIGANFKVTLTWK